MKVGDEVVTKSPFWHCGVDIGDRLGRVIDTESYIVIELYEYDNNPVKCFRREVELIMKSRGKF
jgi:hypothetical protein